jgi:TPR repeat protein
LSEKAEEGSTEACFVLGFIYATGVGTIRNYSAAAQWIKKAARRGDADAQWLMGCFAEYGLGGIPKNTTAALR